MEATRSKCIEVRYYLRESLGIIVSLGIPEEVGNFFLSLVRLIIVQL